MEYLYLDDRSVEALSRDVVAHFERLQQQDDKSSGKVRQVAAQRHACSHTHRCQQGSKGGGVDAQCRDYGNDEQDGEQDVDEGAEKRLDGRVDVAAVERLAQQTVNQPHKETADDIDNDRHKERLARVDAERKRLLKELRQVTHVATGQACDGLFGRVHRTSHCRAVNGHSL